MVVVAIMVVVSGAALVDSTTDETDVDIGTGA
jgi:hypothetical protein